jgi:LemA protein
MSDLSPRIPEDIADDVLRVASELYSQAQNSYDVSDLKAAGQEVDIPPELIEKAIAQVQEQRRLEAETREIAQANQRKMTLIGSGLGALALLWGISSYNSLNVASQKVDGAWAQVENQLQRRADLIPKLVNVTKAQSKNEKEVIQLLLKSRDSYFKAQTPEEKLNASQKMDTALQRFDKVAANSGLVSSTAYTNLQYEIAGTESRIAVERKRYNDSITLYNQKVNAFPSSIVATFTGMKPKEFFKATNTKDPKIDL